MNGDRRGECPQPGGEIADECRPARDPHSGGEVTSHSRRARATHSGREIPVEKTAIDVTSLSTREVARNRGACLAHVRVDIAADVRPAGVNSCWLQRESSFGFSVSKDLRYGPPDPPHAWICGTGAQPASGRRPDGAGAWLGALRVCHQTDWRTDRQKRYRISYL